MTLTDRQMWIDLGRMADETRAMHDGAKSLAAKCLGQLRRIERMRARLARGEVVR